MVKVRKSQPIWWRIQFNAHPLGFIGLKEGKTTISSYTGALKIILQGCIQFCESCLVVKYRPFNCRHTIFSLFLWVAQKCLKNALTANITQQTLSYIPLTVYSYNVPLMWQDHTVRAIRVYVLLANWSEAFDNVCYNQFSPKIYSRNIFLLWCLLWITMNCVNPINAGLFRGSEKLGGSKIMVTMVT